MNKPRKVLLRRVYSLTGCHTKHIWKKVEWPNIGHIYTKQCEICGVKRYVGMLSVSPGPSANIIV